MWSIIHGDLVRPGKTRFATNHIAIDSILKYKSKLENIVYKQQMDRAFNKQNQRRQHEIQPTMPILYDMFQRVKQEISQMPGKQWVLDIIKNRWDKTLSQPLHATNRMLSGCKRIIWPNISKKNKRDQKFSSFTADWWAQWGYIAPNISRIAIRILAQTASSSACEKNWSTFALIHTKQRNRLTYQKLEKLVYCYYNMKLRLRDKRAKDKIMPAHLDDENGNPPPHVVEKATDFRIDINKVLSDEVGDPGDDSDNPSVWGGVATPDSSNSDDDDASGGEFEQFTCESNFDHATQDENHGSRAGGHGVQQQNKCRRRTKGVIDDQSISSDVSSVAFGDVYDQLSSWAHPYYPILGETVGSSKEIYDYHVNHYNSYYMTRGIESGHPQVRTSPLLVTSERNDDAEAAGYSSYRGPAMELQPAQKRAPGGGHG
ncbi:uncharacterized protein LOC126792177 [Argentina anserina]|uniref:uncharacterized protein LOC126792177 n=1 Tax=Argentina anserina TaxID=57926 RepID=UPI0021766AAE|nr:uncharacterized protein LOC126792177 [Potentilla anserina]